MPNQGGRKVGCNSNNPESTLCRSKSSPKDSSWTVHAYFHNLIHRHGQLEEVRWTLDAIFGGQVSQSCPNPLAITRTVSCRIEQSERLKYLISRNFWRLTDKSALSGSDFRQLILPGCSVSFSALIKTWLRVRSVGPIAAISADCPEIEVDLF